MPTTFSLTAFITIAFSLSVVGGTLGAILGLGGGTFIIPLLTLVLGLDIRHAVGASVVAVVATSSGAAVAYIKDKLTNIRIGMALEMGTTVGSIVGAYLSSYVSSKWIYMIFGAVLLYSSSTIFRSRDSEFVETTKPDALAERLHLCGSYFDHSLDRTVNYRAANTVLGLAVMYIAGTIGGLLGIGAGAFKVIGMDQVMRLPIKVSSATSNFMIGVTAAASATVYFYRGQIDPMVTAPVALGVLAGALLGARLMVRLKNKAIRMLFVPVVVWAAVNMIVKGWNL